MSLSFKASQAFAPIADAENARAFYEGILGLTIIEETPFALVVASPGCQLRLAITPEFIPQPFTVFGWVVDDIRAEISHLSAAGVSCVIYDSMGQDADGIWSPAPGIEVCWFKDPDGNLLSLSTQPTI